MNATTKSTRTAASAVMLAIDLAKDVYELAFADAAGQIVERKRLKRGPFAKCLENRTALRIVMEACGSAHAWARRFARLGHDVTLLPAQHVRPYVRRNKTDRADAAGLLEAARCGDIRPVPVKTPEQQGTQGLHRIREHHKAQRTAAINTVRGLLREFGIAIPGGADKVRPATLAALEDGDNDIPMALRHALAALLDQITDQAEAMDAIEIQLADFARRDTRCQRLMAASGVGLITATAMSAGIGDFARFPSGRHFASALGLTPREYSSGGTRKLGRITKQGDVYLRTLLIHGARSALVVAATAKKRDQPLDRTQQWALALAERKGHNKAAVALANKVARRLWAAEHHGTSFDPEHVSRREACAA
ncbi:MAG: IS110 family transposase [Xanthomonadaceae bacterium]|nr:IS110 family transposase [Xanthomonadaceae bacterium]MCO5095153.1 IS110 family transposase [Xanthomonadaceae bacterium]